MLDEIKKILEKVLLELGYVDEINYTVELPPAGIEGDVSTNIAILLSKKLKKNPKEIADNIIEKIKKEKIVSDATFQSGFINIVLADNFLFEHFQKPLQTTNTSYKLDVLKNKKILIEFVSANPTGPLHIGHGRGAAFGDSLARLFEALGANVEREYYINDVGNQMDVLANSVIAYIDKKPLPENGYKGEYIEEIAKEVQSSKFKVQSVKTGLPVQCAKDIFSQSLSIKQFTIDKILMWIKDELERFGVQFDNWFRESSLYEKNDVNKLIEKLEEKKLAYKKDGAVWFKSTEFADDKDRVLIREDGRHTYLASDIAYHLNKYQRNFDTYIDIWGADHHGYVERMKGAVKAIGSDEQKLKIILYQLVNLIKDGKKVNMSTRAGEFITLKKVIDEVGVDATRFFLLMRNSESHLDFDLDLAKKQSPENPVFYIQYAHARICSVLREANKSEVSRFQRDPKSEVRLELLNLKEERNLVKKVLCFGDTLKVAADNYAPHYLTKYLQDIASCFHSYYNRNRIITENTDLTNARLAMCQAVKNVIVNGLNILGVSAPERM